MPVVPSYSMEMRASRTICSMPHSRMKPCPPKTWMPWVVASSDTSVRNPLAIGVSSASSVSARSRSPSYNFV